MSMHKTLIAGWLICSAMSVAQAQWGDVKIQFLIDGKAPDPVPLKVDKDPAVCGKDKLFEEKFVVGKDGGVKDVIVYISPATGQKVPVHSSYDIESEKTKNVVLDNKNCRFEPHVAVLRVGQTLVLKNSDAAGHNSKIDFFSNPQVNPILPANSELPLKNITKAEKRAVPVSCSIHTWMTGIILVQDHPYAGTTGEDGSLSMTNVPVGKWTFQLWQEGIGYVVSATDAAGKKVEWKKGKAEFEVKAGMNDLGTFKIAPPQG